MSSRIAAAAVAVFLSMPIVARASPWTLSPGVALMQTGFDVQLANSEFIDRGGEQAFPLNGRSAGANLNLGIRIGLFDRLELEVGLPVRVVTYVSDPAIVADFSGDDIDQAGQFYRDNVLDFSQTAAGIGDLRIAGRYQIFLQPLAVAAEVGLKIPTGYEGPAGTFGREPSTLDAFEQQQQDLAQPDRVRDDVTLGDAQVDLSASVLVGVAFSTGTFIRASAGYNLRFGGAGDQILGDVRVGQSIGPKILLYGFGRIAYSIQDGDSIGISLVAEDPELGADSFAFGQNIRPIVRPLQTDLLDVGGGAIWRVTRSSEVNVAYTRTVWGRFAAATNTLSLSVGFRLELYDLDDSE